MSSSEGSPSRWSTTGVAAYRRRRDAATQTPVGGENGNSNGIGQGDHMERLIASQNRLAAAIELPAAHYASDVVDGVILLQPVVDPDYVSLFLTNCFFLLTQIFLIPNNNLYACLLDNTIY